MCLTGAKYVILADKCWNPQNERQAIARAWRMGQDKEVIVFHLVAWCEDKDPQGMLEEHIWRTGIVKAALARTILDKENANFVFNSGDLKTGAEADTSFESTLQTMTLALSDHLYFCIRVKVS